MPKPKKVTSAKPSISEFHPDTWPAWPFLPIKNWRDGLCRVAVLFDLRADESGHAFDIAFDTNLFGEEIKTATWVAADLAALESDGWEVD